MKIQDIIEGAPIVVAQAPIDVRNPKKAPQPVRYQGDIVPPSKPPSTEKRGVKGRPGQRPMPKYDESVAEGFKNTYNVGDRVDGPLGTGTIVAVSPNINADGRVKVKLDDPGRAGEDGKYKDSFVLDTTQLTHINEYANT